MKKVSQEMLTIAMDHGLPRELLPNEAGWVNARELHKRLGVKTRFADWVKRNLLDNNAIYGSDYNSFQLIRKRENNRTGSTWSNEYGLSLFMAEHFTMMERTPAARRIRDAYIACRHMLAKALDENHELKAQIEALQRPKQKRLSDGRVRISYVMPVKMIDIFGNVTWEQREVRKYADQLTPEERRHHLLQHLSGIAEGVAKRISKEVRGDNLLLQ